MKAIRMRSDVNYGSAAVATKAFLDKALYINNGHCRLCYAALGYTR